MTFPSFFHTYESEPESGLEGLPVVNVNDCPTVRPVEAFKDVKEGTRAYAILICPVAPLLAER